MKDMKMTKAERKDNAAPIDVGGNDNKYPYGLTLDLGNEALATLGMSALPKVGEDFQLNAKVVVKAVRESERVKGKPEKNMELQITHMELDTKGDRKKQASTLYSK